MLMPDRIQTSDYSCPLSMRGIIERAADHFGVSLIDILSPRRDARIVDARSVAMYAIRDLLPRSYPEIARAFGGRDHTTVMHACRSVARAMATDPDKRGRVEAFLAQCRAGAAAPMPADPARPAETFHVLAALVAAGLETAGLQRAAEQRLAGLQARLAPIEPRLFAFLHAYRALASASPRGEGQARARFEAEAAALAVTLQTHFLTKGPLT
jgi:hypothetical protein